MKYKVVIYIIGILTISFTGCIENVDPTWHGAQIEFDAAIYNSPAAGKTFPILTRVPAYGRAVNTANTAFGTADPTITRTSGVVVFYVNLIGKHRTDSETLNISVVAEETTATGVHYTLPATITLDANSSVAQVPVTILDPGATSGSVVLVLQLDGNSEIGPSENYKRLGISIAQN